MTTALRPTYGGAAVTTALRPTYGAAAATVTAALRPTYGAVAAAVAAAVRPSYGAAAASTAALLPTYGDGVAVPGVRDGARVVVAVRLPLARAHLALPTHADAVDTRQRGIARPPADLPLLGTAGATYTRNTEHRHSYAAQDSARLRKHCQNE